MATFVTLFAASESELDAVFPGWVQAPPEPTLVTVEDPDTGEACVERRWFPESGQAQAFGVPGLQEVCSPLRAPVLAPESEYEQHMEQRAPVVLRTLEHACIKNMSGEHLDVLASVVLGHPAQGRPARVTPDGFAIESLDAGATAALAAMPSGALGELAERWAREAKGFEGPPDALWVLRRVHALAGLCGRGARRLCLWAER